jgi:hypothetical protein
MLPFSFQHSGRPKKSAYFCGPQSTNPLLHKPTTHPLCHSSNPFRAFAAPSAVDRRQPDAARHRGMYRCFWSMGARHHGNPNIVVGRDGRISGEIASALVVNTLRCMGISVIDLGLEHHTNGGNCCSPGKSRRRHHPYGKPQSERMERTEIAQPQGRVHQRSKRRRRVLDLVAQKSRRICLGRPTRRLPPRTILISQNILQQILAHPLVDVDQPFGQRALK